MAFEGWYYWTFIGLPTTFTAPPAVVLTVKLSVSLSTGA
jgi:hypothetical protein